MSVYPPNRYVEVEPARVQHGRSFVQSHQPASVLLSTTNNRIQTNNPQQQQQQKMSKASLPTMNVTLSTSTRNLNQSMRGGDNLNNTTLNQSQRGGLNNSTRLNTSIGTSNSNAVAIPSHLLHPNHITDVFPDAMQSLTKNEEHTYSGSHNPTTNGAPHDHSNNPLAYPPIHHAHTYTLSSSLSHHKIPLRMPVGPNVSAAHMNGQTGGNLFDNNNVSGMDDSTYPAPNAAVNAGLVSGGNTSSAQPHLSQVLQADRVAPLQRENLRLVRSNNALQAHLVAEGERIEESERQWAQEMRNIKTKHADLQFLFAQKTRKIANQEQKINELQQRLEQVLSDRQAYVKESIEAPSRLTHGAIQPSSTFRAASEISPSELNQLKQHESKIAQLQAELSAHESRASEWATHAQIYENKLKTRDEEIKRLSEVLESERNWDKMQVEFELKRLFKNEQKLQQQIDYLNEQRGLWEKDIQSFKEMGVSASYMTQLHTAQNQTKQMEGEYQQAMHRMNQLQSQIETQRLQLDKYEASNQSVNEHAQAMLDERNREMEELQRKFNNLLDENENRGITIDTLNTQLEQARAKLPTIDVGLLQENYKREEAARQVLREQYNKLVRDHDELLHRSQQVANELSQLKNSSARDISSLNSDLIRAQYLNEDFQRKLKDLSESKANLSEESGALKNKVELSERMKEGIGGERDYYKNQAQELTNSLHLVKLDLQQRDDSIQLLQRQIGSLEAQLNESIKDRSRLMSETQKDQALSHQYESEITALKSDLAQVKHQNQNLNEIVAERNEILNNISDLNVTQRGLVRTNEKLKTQLESVTKEKENLFDRLSSMTSERDQLLQSLSSTDGSLLNIQNEVVKLQAEREAKEEAYANLYHDFTDVNQQLADIKQSKFPNLQQNITSLKQENERLQSTIHELQSNTVQKLTTVEQQQKQEIFNLKTANSELNKRLEKEQDHSGDLQSKVTSLEHELQTMLQQSSTKQSQLHSNQTLLSHHTDLIAKLNLQISELKQVCRTVEGQKKQVETEWKHVMSDFEHCKQELKNQMDVNTNQSILIQNKGQECVELKTQLNLLAESKAALEMELHNFELKHSALQQECAVKGDNASQLNHVLNENASHTSLLQDTLRAKEYELSELLSQIQALQKANQKLSEDNALKSADLKAILQDLENVIKENQLLTKELTGMKATVEARSMDSERVVSRLTHTEEQFRAKELEVLDLLSNYRSVCLENERLKIAGDELENERKNARITMKQQQDALFKQETALRASENENRKRAVDLQALEATVQELGRALESQKKALDAAANEKAELIRALENSKQLGQGFEQSRMDHVRALAESKSNISKLNGDIQSLQLDNQHLVNTLQQARDHNNNLEKIIAQLRGSSVLGSEQVALNLQEKSAQLGSLQQELQNMKGSVESLQEQLQAAHEYRSKQNEEINRLLNQLSSGPSGSPTKASSAELLSQIKSLQQVIDSQFLKLQELQKERAKLKAYIVKYEAELRGWENRAQGIGAQQQQPHEQANASQASFFVERA